jgi:hypothetical protein
VVERATRRSRDGCRVSAFSARTLESALIARPPFVRPPFPRSSRTQKLHPPCHSRTRRNREISLQKGDYRPRRGGSGLRWGLLVRTVRVFHRTLLANPARIAPRVHARRRPLRRARLAGLLLLPFAGTTKSPLSRCRQDLLPRTWRHPFFFPENGNTRPSAETKSQDEEHQRLSLLPSWLDREVALRIRSAETKIEAVAETDSCRERSQERPPLRRLARAACRSESEMPKRAASTAS